MAEHQEDRLQAGPIPSKRGEIGYQEGVHVPSGDASEGQSDAESSNPLPARHPADTPLPSDNSNPSFGNNPPSSPANLTSGAASNVEAPASIPPPSDSSPVHHASKFSTFLHCKQVPNFAGLRVTTLSMFVLQILILGGTIAGWVVLIQHMQASTASSSHSESGQDSGLPMNSALIFVYVAFAVMTLVQIVFLERSSFRLRAERYAYLHPGEVLPSHRNRSQGRPAMAFVPWNRPPLPTYAAALAQSGVGTGDVEDNIIAVPPPPAYGDTRASTLLLAGATSNRLRTQQLRSSAGTGMSWTEVRRMSQSNRSVEGGTDRPKSYMSTDPEWEEVLDAERAARLEETLAKLEEGDVTGR